MSRILLVIGLSSAKASAEPELVYLGRSGDAMRAAMAAATHPRFLIVPHVQGIPKNNSRAALNAATAEDAAAAADEADLQLEAAVATVEQLRAEVAELRAQLAAASPQPGKSPGTPPLPPPAPPQRPK